MSIFVLMIYFINVGISLNTLRRTIYIVFLIPHTQLNFCSCFTAAHY